MTKSIFDIEVRLDIDKAFVIGLHIIWTSKIKEINNEIKVLEK